MTAPETPDLDAIQARADAATPGPWRADDEHGALGPTASPAWCVSATKNGGDWSYDLFYSAAVEYRNNEVADSEFVAAARTDVPLLVAALRVVQKLHNPIYYDYRLGQWTTGDARPERTLCIECTGSKWPCETYLAAGGVA